MEDRLFIFPILRNKRIKEDYLFVCLNIIRDTKQKVSKRVKEKFHTSKIF